MNNDPTRRREPSLGPLATTPDQRPWGGDLIPDSRPIPAAAGGWTAPPLPPPPIPPTGSRGSQWPFVFLAAVMAALALLGGVGIGWGVARIGHAAATPARSTVAQAQSPIQSVPQINGSGSANSINVQAIANQVSPTVVDVNTVMAAGGQAAGTGMVLTSTGEVLTNNHVVHGASSIQVTLAGQTTTHSAHVIGVNVSADVALIQVDGVSGLPTVTLANSSTLTVGEAVVALGNALGQGGAPSVTQGQVTALDQSITAGTGGANPEQLTGLIQTDASISPGDSGGPLVNASGQVVGMITAGATQGRRQTSTTVGFAIASNSALAVVNQIRAGDTSSGVLIGLPGYIGVQVRNLDSATAAQLGLSATSGALVMGTVPGSPAELAGLSRYAVITAINGNSIASADALGPAIQAFKPGQRIQVTWVDQNGGTHTATLTLVPGPAA